MIFLLLANYSKTSLGNVRIKQTNRTRQTAEHTTPVMLLWEGISGVVPFVRWTAATADKAWGELGLV